MTPLLLYFIYTSLVMVAGVEVWLRKRQVSNQAGFFVLVCLVLFSALRAPGFGSDDLAYVDILNGVSAIESCKDWLCGYSYDDFNIEFGFYGLLLLVTVVGAFPFLMFGIVGWISLSASLKAIERFSPYVIPPLLLYFSHHFLAKELNALRLALAGALVFYAGSCCVDRRYKVAFLIILAASLFHVSALIAMVPVLMCDWGRRNPRKIALVFLMMGLVKELFFSEDIYQIFSLVDFIDSKTSLYMGAEQYNYSLSLVDPVNVKNLILIFLCFIGYEKISKTYEGFGVALIFFGFAVMIRLAFSDFAILAGRAFGMLSVFECVLAIMVAFHYLGRKLGFIAIVIYSFGMLTLNLFISSMWLGGRDYFNL